MERKINAWSGIGDRSPKATLWIKDACFCIWHATCYPGLKYDSSHRHTWLPALLSSLLPHWQDSLVGPHELLCLSHTRTFPHMLISPTPESSSPKFLPSLLFLLIQISVQMSPQTNLFYSRQPFRFWIKQPHHATPHHPKFITVLPF